MKVCPERLVGGGCRGVPGNVLSIIYFPVVYFSYKFVFPSFLSLKRFASCSSSSPVLFVCLHPVDNVFGISR